MELTALTDRFTMLPQSIRRRLETDQRYWEARTRIIDSTSTKELLTALRHWSFMMPDTLAHILQDVKIDQIHQQVEKYKQKVLNFKQNTRLGDLMGTNFPVPDYCIELTVEVEGWEDKTIDEAEKAVVNILRGATGGHNVPVAWKAMRPGSMKLVLMLLDSVKVSSDMLLGTMKYTGVISIEVDGDIIYWNKSEQKVNSYCIPRTDMSDVYSACHTVMLFTVNRISYSKKVGYPDELHALHVKYV